MLMQLLKPLKEAASSHSTFVFEHGGTITVDANIAGGAASKPPG